MTEPVTDYRQSPQVVGSLADAAVLVICRFRCWTGVRRDRAVTQYAIDGHRARAGAGRFDKFLLGSRSLNNVMNAMATVRNHVNHHTQPWGENDGIRILPTTNYLHFVDGVSDLQDAYEKAVRAFIEAYPRLVEESRERLGDMFREEDYPKAESLSENFTMSISFMPMPDTDDFRVKLSQEHIDVIKEQIEAEVRNNVALAMNDLWERLHDGVSKLAKQLTRIDEEPVDSDGKSPAPYVRTRTLTKLAELMDLLPRLNLTNDPRLEEARQRLRAEVLGVGATALKEDPEARRRAMMAADDILSMMGITGPAKAA
jgi:hypothetical protein